MVVAVAALGMLPSPARGQDLWPLAEFSKDRTVVLYPFYVHEGDFMMVFPFYYRTNQGRDHHYVWPLVKFSEGRLTRVAPVWYHADADTFTVFPLLRQTPDYTFWTLPPIYTRHDGKFLALFPLFAKSPNMLFVAPSFYKSKGGDSGSLGIFPIYFSQWAPGRTWSMVPLVYSYAKKGDDLDLWTLPLSYTRMAESIKYETPLLFKYARDKHGFRFWLLPFKKVKTDTEREIGVAQVWTYREQKLADGVKTTLMLLPYGQVRSPKKSTSFVIPFFFERREKVAGGEAKDFWLLPWVQGSAPGGSYHGLLPIYHYAEKNREGERRQTFNLLWPVYRREVTTGASGDTLEYQRRFLFFSESQDRSGARVFRMLGIPIVERTR